MSQDDTESVPRTPEEPLPDHVYEELTPCEPYTVSDVAEIFSEASRWTIQRRLDTLVEDGLLSKKKHSERRVSYWIPQ